MTLRAMIVHPGPAWATADVHRGWVRGLKANGVRTCEFNTGERMTFYENAHLLDDDGEWKNPLSLGDIARILANGIHAAAYQFLPHIVVVISARYIPDFTYDILRRNGTRVVVVHTESPYEDDEQQLIADHVDLNLINDPTNLDRWRQIAPTEYIPHAYDPNVHTPGPSDYALDFGWVGTAGATFPSRTRFLNAVDWTGINAGLAGLWQDAPADSPALAHLIPALAGNCVSNDETVNIYRGSKTTANIYRAEANSDELVGGWAMGPREVEAAATGGALLLRHSPDNHGGEGDQVLPMLPRFTEPGELGDLIRFYTAHEYRRRDLVTAARAAIADRTFENHAAQLLRWLDV